MDSGELAFAPAYELRELLDSREVSSVELTEMFLGRIEELNPVLNAYLTVSGEEAMESAKSGGQADRPGQEGPAAFGDSRVHQGPGIDEGNPEHDGIPGVS